MRKPQSTLVALLAASLFVVAGCDSDDSGPKDTGGTDTSTADTGTADTGTADADTTTEADVDASVCGSRECGVFAGEDCGSCSGDEECNAAGRCELPGAPMGAFCGVTTTCNDGSPNWNDGECIDNQCDSRNCLSNSGAVALLRDVCSLGCTIYQDSDGNGVNDVDASLSDCNPSDIVDGPAGNSFRCVNFAAPGQSPVGVCAPGSEFAECNSDADCPTGEGCDLTTIGGDYNFRCVANNKAGAWGEIAQLSEACNSDPREGAVASCETGLCFGVGCVNLCDVPAGDAGADALCDTTKVYPGTGCVANKCAGTTKDCTEDFECSSWKCDDARQLLGDGQGGLAGPEWRMCWPKDCVTDAECGGGFYCDLTGWNGETGDAAAFGHGCFAQNPEGVDAGEACDSNPDDSVPGAVCKNESWCVGGFCGALCEDDADCVSGQKCTAQESTGDLDDDGEIDIALPIQFCLTFEDVADPEVQCIADTDCGSGEVCDIYAVWDGADADAPMQLNGVCTVVDTTVFPGETGDYGTGCSGGADCKSGFCLGATETTQGYCTKSCAATTECGSVTIGGDSANGVCNSLLFGYGGAPDDITGYNFIDLCQLTLSSVADCSSDFTCAGDTEVCFPNVLTVDPTKAPTTEYICQALVEEGTALPTGALGTACDLDSEDAECASGICFDDGAGNGYCSELCSDTVDNCGSVNVAGAALECLTITTRPRRGAYVDNSAGFNACVVNPTGADCDEDYDCDGDYVCNAGGTCEVAAP